MQGISWLFQILLIGFIVEIILHIATWLANRSTTVGAKWGAFVSRAGMLLGAGLGLLLGFVTPDWGWALGLAGGWTSSWTYALITKFMGGR